MKTTFALPCAALLITFVLASSLFGQQPNNLVCTYYEGCGGTTACLTNSADTCGGNTWPIVKITSYASTQCEPQLNSNCTGATPANECQVNFYTNNMGQCGTWQCQYYVTTTICDLPG